VKKDMERMKRMKESLKGKGYCQKKCVTKIILTPCEAASWNNEKRRETEREV